MQYAWERSEWEGYDSASSRRERSASSSYFSVLERNVFSLQAEVFCVVTPRSWYPAAKLHGVTTQKTTAHSESIKGKSEVVPVLN
jgi:hypothetical protein